MCSGKVQVQAGGHTICTVLMGQHGTLCKGWQGFPGEHQGGGGGASDGLCAPCKCLAKYDGNNSSMVQWFGLAAGAEGVDGQE